MKFKFYKIYYVKNIKSNISFLMSTINSQIKIYLKLIILKYIGLIFFYREC